MNKRASAIYTLLTISKTCTINHLLDFLWQIGFDPYESGREVFRQLLDGALRYTDSTMQTIELRESFQ